MTTPIPTDNSNASNMQGEPIAFTPYLLRKLEEQLVVAEKCGYDEITFEGRSVRLHYGQLLACSIRQEFNSVYSTDLIDWVVGPAPDFANEIDMDWAQSVISHLSPVTFRPHSAPLPPAQPQSKLADDQLAFLHKYGIPMSKVLDASGMRSKEWKGAMADLDMWVAFGVPKCKKAGHQLRSRNSDCLQCRPAAIGYVKRYFSEGDVYIASSISTGRFKVGSAKNTEARIAALCGCQYGGASDWKLEASFACNTAGKAEFEAHRILASHLAYGTYYKDGEVKECRELFTCDLETVLDAVESAVESHGME